MCCSDTVSDDNKKNYQRAFAASLRVISTMLGNVFSRQDLVPNYSKYEMLSGR